MGLDASGRWKWARVPQQVRRLGIVFAVLVGGLIIARRLLIPATFGERGHYRFAAVSTIPALPPRWGVRGVPRPPGGTRGGSDRPQAAGAAHARLLPAVSRLQSLEAHRLPAD